MSRRVIGSKAPNGSSSKITGGSAARARATPTRCRWPPESSARQSRGESLGIEADHAQQLARALLNPLRRPTFQARHHADIFFDG